MRRRHGEQVRRCAAVLVTTWLATGCATTPPLPKPSDFRRTQSEALDLRYFGTSTLAISAGRDTVLVDGFFSRPRQRTLLFSSIGLARLEPNAERIRKGLQSLDGLDVRALLVAHAHHDHAMDTASVLQRHPGAGVHGSGSVLHVIRGQELRYPDGTPVAGTAKAVTGGQHIDVHPFSITVIDATHETSPFGPGGDVAPAFRTPAKLRDYKAGRSYTFHVAHPAGTILVVPSYDGCANATLYKAYPADVVLLGIGQLGLKRREEIEAYWDAMVVATGAKHVHPIHWDNFMHELDPAGMRSMWFDRMERSRTELCRLARRDGVGISLLPFASPVPVPATQVSGPAFCPADDG